MAVAKAKGKLRGKQPKLSNKTQVSWGLGLVLETPNQLPGFDTANFYAHGHE
ncbi:hypothetical protein EV648_110247 [Kribbella sp. VKM Ac-2568]|nr:hypothetical protein EV648_110247 [Kribbella sp. VKM Ac-2568]